MISPTPLTAEQRHRSQFFYNLFCSFNGLSYICVGETMMILFAVAQGAPNWMISALGAQLYLGYLLLPLGKVVTGKVGAAKCQSVFWLFRNLTALCIAATAFLAYHGWHALSMIILLVGSFAFYGLRAAGVVMSQPLIAGITDEEELPRWLAVSNSCFYAAGMLALFIIYFILSWKSGLWILASIMATGSILGFTAAHFMARVDEPATIQESAKVPFTNQFRELAGNKMLRQQIPAVFAANYAIVTISPLSLLALKRGYNVSDNSALLYSMLIYLAAATVSFGAARFASTFGPRKTALAGYLGMCIVALLWCFAPNSSNPLMLTSTFFIIGGGMISMNNSLAHYFIHSIPKEHHVVASMGISVIGCVAAGLTAMAVNSLLLRLLVSTKSTIGEFRIFFIWILLIMLPGIWAFLRLTPLPSELREKIRHEPLHRQ